MVGLGGVEMVKFLKYLRRIERFLVRCEKRSRKDYSKKTTGGWFQDGQIGTAPVYNSQHERRRRQMISAFPTERADFRGIKNSLLDGRSQLFHYSKMNPAWKVVRV
nr:uncharacterized protein LOC129487882 isoform X2 [Symphalangus syndactylus]